MCLQAFPRGFGGFSVIGLVWIVRAQMQASWISGQCGRYEAESQFAIEFGASRSYGGSELGRLEVRRSGHHVQHPAGACRPL